MSRIFWVLLATLVLLLCARGDDGETGTEGDGQPDQAMDQEPGMMPDMEADATPEMEPDDRVRETVFPIAYVARNRSEIPGIEQGGSLNIIASDKSFGPVKINPDGKHDVLNVGRGRGT